MLNFGLSPDLPSPSSTVSVEQHTPGPHELNDSPASCGVATAPRPSSQFWVRVMHLCPATSQKELQRIFFPHGCDEALLCDAVDDSGNRVGFVGFGCATAAQLAAEKVNAFIPHGQRQPLSVEQVSRQEVADAVAQPSSSVPRILFRTPTKGVVDCTTSLSRLLEMSTTMPRHLAHYIQQQDNVKATVAEIVDIVERPVTQARLRKLADGLGCIMESWPGSGPLRNDVVRALLEQIFAASETRDATATIGRLMGYLFVNRFITGDPFEFATKLLADSTTLPRIRCVAAMIEECNTMVFPLTSAVYWARIADIASTARKDSVRQACQDLLASRYLGSSPKRQSLSPLAKPFIAPTQTPSITTKKRMDEVRSRTVYMYHLDPMVLQGALMALLETFGSVRKVRVYHRRDFTTLYGFVEFATSDSVRRICEASNFPMLGSLRFQPAKSPIQDVNSADAPDIPFLPDGAIIRCMFSHGSEWRRVADCAVQQ